MRAETGPMEFHGDWRGVFIRGDNAAYYAMILEQLLEKEDKNFYAIVLNGLVSDLKGSDQSGKPELLQRMKPFEECVYAVELREQVQDGSGTGSEDAGQLDDYDQAGDGRGDDETGCGGGDPSEINFDLLRNASPGLTTEAPKSDGSTQAHDEEAGDKAL
jgi:hypothetical protein